MFLAGNERAECLHHSALKSHVGGLFMPRVDRESRLQFDRERHKKNSLSPEYVERRRAYYRNYYQTVAKERRRKSTPHGKELRCAQEKRKRKRIKLQAFNAYGGPICACCGITEICFLSLDHINGRPDERGPGKLGGLMLYKKLRREKWPPGFRVLCMNCNWGRRLNGGICPHQIRKSVNSSMNLTSQNRHNLEGQGRLF